MSLMVFSLLHIACTGLKAPSYPAGVPPQSYINNILRAAKRARSDNTFVNRPLRQPPPNYELTPTANIHPMPMKVMASPDPQHYQTTRRAPSKFDMEKFKEDLNYDMVYGDTSIVITDVGKQLHMTITKPDTDSFSITGVLLQDVNEAQWKTFASATLPSEFNGETPPDDWSFECAGEQSAWCKGEIGNGENDDFTYDDLSDYGGGAFAMFFDYVNDALQESLV